MNLCIFELCKLLYFGYYWIYFLNDNYIFIINLSGIFCNKIMKIFCNLSLKSNTCNTLLIH